MKPAARFLVPVFCAAWIAAESAAASGLRDDCDITIAQDGSAAYRTVQEGLKSAFEGAALCIEPGTYDLSGFSGTFHVRLSLIGRNAGATVLKNGGPLKFSKGFTVKNLTFSDYRDPVFVLVPGTRQTQDGILIEGNVFSRSGSILKDDSQAGAGIRNVSIVGNRFSDLSSDKGVRAIGLSGEAALERITVRNNSFHNLRSTNDRKYAMAIMVGANDTRDKNRNIDISCNTFDGIVGGTRTSNGNDHPETHAVLAYGDHISVASNIVRNINQSRDHEAIYLKANHSRIVNNTVDNGGADGGGGDITIKGGAYENNLVSGNRVTGAQEGVGIFVTGEALVEDNYIDKPGGRRGIVAFGRGKAVDIRNNLVYTKGKSIAVHDVGGGQITNNVLSNLIDVNNSTLERQGNLTGNSGDPSCGKPGVCPDMSFRRPAGGDCKVLDGRNTP